MERISVPFFGQYYSPSYTNSTRISGVVRKEQDALVVEFRETRTDYSTMKETVAPIREVRIPFHEIDSLDVRWRFPFGSKLVLTTHSMAILDGLPNVEATQATFKIPWQERLRARELAATTSLHLLDRSLKELGEGGLV